MLSGKKGVILGVANKRSIAWGIAQAAAQAGATLALNYQSERLAASVRELADTLDRPLVAPCDVTSDADIAAFFAQVQARLGALDFLVHAVAYAPKDDLDGQFVDTSREGFRIAHDISAYSLTAVARAALPLMKDGGGSIVTLTYLGSERAVAGYNVMGVAKAALEASVRYLAADLGPYGIRVNAISAGPINTLAARGIHGFTKMLKHHAAMAPLRRPTEVAEVADTALFLISSMGRGVTGEVIHVDGGYHCIGLVPRDEPSQG